MTTLTQRLAGWLWASEKPGKPAAAVETSRLEFSAPVELRAAEAGEGENGETKRPTFSVTAYTGVVMNAGGFYYPVIVELSGLTAARGELPVLMDHDPSRIVGQGTPKITAKGVTIEGTVTGDDGDAKSVVTHAKNGFKWQASIGASVTRREFLEAGKTVRVNGNEVAGPAVIAREAVLKEVSFVAIGADSNTTAAVAASSQGSDQMKFEQWLQANGFDPAAITAAQKPALQAAFDAELAAATAKNAAPPAAPVAAPAAPVAELQASSAIAELRAEHKRLADIDRLCGDKHAEIKAKAISEGWTSDACELAVLRASHSSAPMGFVRSSEEATPQMLEAAICLSGKLDGVEKLFDEKTLEAADRRFRRNLGLQEMLLEAAWQGGYSGRHFKGSERAVLRAAFSTLSLPGIMANTANKFLLAGFTHVEAVHSKIATRRTVTDFKTVTSYRMTGAFQFEEVAKGGELKHGNVGEESFTNRAKTYGKMFNISREDLINDDLGALTDLPRKIGRGAALKLNDVFWTAFLADASTFYTTARGNYFEGAGTTLQSSQLGVAEKMFLDQVDTDSKPLGVSPKYLLVPTALSEAASELYVSTNNNTGGSSSTAKVPNRNIYAGRFEPIVTAYLGNSAYTGYSATAFYLIADPMDLPLIEVAYLNGQESPTIETAEADFDVLGIQMRGYFDFGVAKQDYRAAVKSKGAA